MDIVPVPQVYGLGKRSAHGLWLIFQLASCSHRPCLDPIQLTTMLNNPATAGYPDAEDTSGDAFASADGAFIARVAARGAATARGFDGLENSCQ